jgi:hypothetical protein
VFVLYLNVLGCEDEKPQVSDTATEGPSSPLDADGDGFEEDDDCDDADAAVHPEADEICNDQDDDCDTLVDDDDPDRVGGTDWPADNDGDGYFSMDQVVTACEGPVGEPGDCNDSDASISPGAPEDSEADGQDENCNGWADETAEHFADATFSLASGSLYAVPSGLGDINGDGVADFTADGDHVYFGGARRLGEHELVETCDLALLGGIVSAAGDQDGDGTSDVWVEGEEAYLVLDLSELEGQRVNASEGEGDFDGDGFIDFGMNMFDYYWFSSVGYLMPGGSMGGLDASLALGEVSGPYDMLMQVAVTPDLDGDGLGELLTFDYETMALWPGGTTPGSSHSEANSRVSAPLWWLHDAADIDGDGFLDLLGCDESNERCYVLRELDLPAGQAALEDVAWLTLSGVMRMVAIDLNGDGTVDLVASDRHADNGAGVVYLFDGAALPGDGSLEPSEAIGRWRGDAPDVGLGWQLDNVGDVDADGYEDLMFSTYVAPSGAGSVAYLVYGEPPVP